MVNLEYYNIKIGRSEHSKDIVIRGEIVNKSDKNYSSISLRIVLFVKNISIASVVVLVNGISSGASKVFEKNVEDLEYDAIAKDITRYEVYVESAY
ncbi:MAG: hypothetical protein V1869_05455 [Candidatus Omnitrophota bacterium]